MKCFIPFLFELSASKKFAIDNPNFRIKDRCIPAFTNSLIDLSTFPRETGRIKVGDILGKESNVYLADFSKSCLKVFAVKLVGTVHDVAIVECDDFDFPCLVFCLFLMREEGAIDETHDYDINMKCCC